MLDMLVFIRNTLKIHWKKTGDGRKSQMDAAPQKIRVMLVKIPNPQKIRAVMFFVKIPNPQKIGAVMVLGDGPDGRHTPRTVQWPWTHPPPSQSLYQLTLMRTQR